MSGEHSGKESFKAARRALRDQEDTTFEPLERDQAKMRNYRGAIGLVPGPDQARTPVNPVRVVGRLLVALLFVGSMLFLAWRVSWVAMLFLLVLFAAVLLIGLLVAMCGGSSRNEDGDFWFIMWLMK
jgi:hypothetical protein